MSRYKIFGRGWPKKPGQLVYFGGAVHEVLRDGHSTRVRRDLVPGSPKHLWKPRWTKSPARVRAGRKAAKMHKRREKNARIKKAFSKNKGALHRQLRVPQGEKSPSAASAGPSGKVDSSRGGRSSSST